MKRAILLDASGAPLWSELTNCYLPELQAGLEWRILGVVERTYRATARFTLDGPGGALRPIALYPVVYEWPRNGPDHEPRALTISVPRRCGPDPGEVIPVRLELPAIDEFSCVGESLGSGGDPHWCRPIQPGNEVYRIREWHPFNMANVYHRVLVVFESGRARVTLDERTIQLADAQQLLAVFNEIWDVPTEVGESCRDGALKLVEGRRPDRWKVVLRHCQPIVDFDRVSKAVAEALRSSP